MTPGPEKIRSSFDVPLPGPPTQEVPPAPAQKAARPPAPKAAAPQPKAAAPGAKPKLKAPEPEPEPSEFLQALADLLRSRKLEVPSGLLEAPPSAYAGQGAGTVEMMARLKDEDLLERAGKVAGWQARQQERAQWAWDSSPLIRELRRRELPVPERPARVGAMAVSLKRPLAEWSDGELTAAVTEWTRLGER